MNDENVQNINLLEYYRTIRRVLGKHPYDEIANLCFVTEKLIEIEVKRREEQLIAEAIQTREVKSKK